MFTAYKDYWKNYGNFKGTATRSQYWYVFMLTAFISVSWLFLIQLIKTMMTLLGSNGEFGLTIFSRMVLLIWAIINFWPYFALTARRLRDAKLEWGLIIITMMPSALLVTYWIFWIIVSLVQHSLSPFDEGDIGVQTGIFRLSLWFFALMTNIVMIILCSQPSKDELGNPVGYQAPPVYQGQTMQGNAQPSPYWGAPQPGFGPANPAPTQQGPVPQAGQPAFAQVPPQQGVVPPGMPPQNTGQINQTEQNFYQN